jgi:hypothetical protein
MNDVPSLLELNWAILAVIREPSDEHISRLADAYGNFVEDHEVFFEEQVLPYLETMEADR